MEDNRQNPEIEERNVTLDEDPISSMTEDQLQESILEDSGMNAFQKYCARMSEARWTLVQRIAGALLGITAGVSLFWDTLARSEAEQQSIFSIPLIIAIFLALILPNIIEKQALRRIPKLRITMVIALALVIVIYFIAIGMQTGFRFTA